ncbi:hypothetical protein AVEN_91048-1, partial [Araneus ventricosus]
SVLFYL